MLEADLEGTEVASFLHISPDTLYDRCKEEKNVLFSEYLRLKKDRGNGRIKQRQYQLAMEGDRAMLIWLGKQRLGQSEKNETKTDQPLVIEMHVSKATNDAIADIT